MIVPAEAVVLVEEVLAQNPRGCGDCAHVAIILQRRWPDVFTGEEGVFVDRIDDVVDLRAAIEANRVYTHWWTWLPDGRIFDGTAGQFHVDGDVIRTIDRTDPEFESYLSWSDIPDDLRDAVDDAVQGSYPDPCGA